MDKNTRNSSANSKEGRPETPLSHLSPNQGGVIVRVETPRAVTQRLLEMGIALGEYVKYIRKAPLGDPIEIELLNYRLAIRKSVAGKIFLHCQNPVQF